MKVLVLSCSNIVAQRTILIARLMRDAGNECLLLCWQREPQDAYLEGLDSRIIRTRGRRFISYATEVARVVLKESFDCLEFSDFRLFPLLIPLSRIRGASLLYDAQEVPTSTIAEKVARRLRSERFYPLANRCAIAVENMFLRFVGGIVTIPVSEEELTRYRRSGRRVEVVPNYPSLLSRPLPLEDPMERIGNRRYLVYAGALSRSNGLELYLALIKRLAEREDLLLVIAGKPVEITENELSSLAAECGVGSRVLYLQWIQYEKLLTLLKGAILGLALLDPENRKYQRISEGTSRKIYTYMSCGVPVVVNPPFDGVVCHERCGISVPYGDLDRFVHQVRELINDGERLGELSRNGRNAFERAYNWEHESKKILEVVRAINH